MDRTPSQDSLPRTGVQRFKSRHKKGKVIELQDNSQWEIPGSHQMFTDHWTEESNITVVPGTHPGYPYDLINPDSGDRIPARYRGIVSPPTGWQMLDH